MIASLTTGQDDSHPWTTSRASAVKTRIARSTATVTLGTSQSATATAHTSRSGSFTATRARPASRNAKGLHCSTVACPKRRPFRFCIIWSKGTEFVRPNDSPACIATRSCGWHAWPGRTPKASTRNSWPFPPETREIQLDEKGSFVAKKQAHCDPTDPTDDHKGDWWDHVAYDAEHRLVLAVVPGARSIENAEEVVQEVHDRTAGRADVLFTSDAYPAYASAIDHVYGVPEAPKPPGTPGRRPVEPPRHAPPDLKYATVHKERENGRVVAIVTAVVLGTWQAVAGVLKRSAASRTINTSFVERHHGTDRHHNARKSRRTYRFSKDWRMHEAMTYFTMYSYNYCWPVRTLRERDSEGAWRKRTPAMAAGLTDHVWSLKEWLTFPAIQ